MAFQQEQSQEQVEDEAMFDDDDDAMDQDELEALLFYAEEQSTVPQRPPSPSLSDDDYDGIFAELIAQEHSSQKSNQYQPTEEIEMADRMEMSQ